MPKDKRMRILSEVDGPRPIHADDVQENPYWQEDEAPQALPPGTPCQRRGHCCRASPGWFMPGQVEAAAAFLGLDPVAFIRRYLIVDAYDLDGRQVEVFAPVKLGRDGAPLVTPGTRVDRLYRIFRSPCVFFRDNGCQIYPVRPAECAAYLCSLPQEEHLSHREIAQAWANNHDPNAAT